MSLVGEELGHDARYQESRSIYRTNQHYHITVETDGNAVQVNYSLV